MFLTPNNKLKPKWILWGTVITFVLVLMGVFGLDNFLYPIINNPECNVWFFNSDFWCAFAFVLGKVFSTKMWLLITGLLLLLVFAKKSLDSGIKYKDAKQHFNLIVLAKDFMSKVRTNYAFLIFSSVVLAVLTCGVLKVLIGRPRPMMLFDGFHQFIFDWAFNSMPSGHTAATFAGLVMAGMLSPKIKPFTWTIAIIVGLSRVYIGAHWPSDVIFGAFIGMSAADVVKYLAFRHK